MWNLSKGKITNSKTKTLNHCLTLAKLQTSLPPPHPVDFLLCLALSVLQTTWTFKSKWETDNALVALPRLAYSTVLMTRRYGIHRLSSNLWVSEPVSDWYYSAKMGYSSHFGSMIFFQKKTVVWNWRRPWLVPLLLTLYHQLPTIAILYWPSTQHHLLVTPTGSGSLHYLREKNVNCIAFEEGEGIKSFPVEIWFYFVIIGHTALVSMPWFCWPLIAGK